MSFWSTLKDVVSVGSDVASGYSAYKQYEMAEKQQKLQERELRRQQAAEAARAKREARVRTARLYASQGQAGAILSGTQSGVIGIDATLASGLEGLEERTEFNIESSELQEQGQKTGAIVKGIGSIPTAAASTQKLFTDLIEN